MISSQMRSWLCGYALAMCWYVQSIAVPGEDASSTNLLQNGAVHALTHRTLWAVAWSPDGTVVATGGDDFDVVLVESQTMTTSGLLDGHNGSVYSLCFNETGDELISVGYDGDVIAWDVAKRSISARVPVGDGRLFEVAHVGPDHLATGGSNGVLRLLQRSDFRTIQAFRLEGRIAGLAYSKVSGRLVVTAPLDSVSAVWELDRCGGGFTVPRPCAHAHTSDMAVAFSANGWLAVGGLETSGIRLWSPDGRKASVLPGHEIDTRSISFDRLGQRCASTGQDSTVRLWDTTTGKLIGSARPFASGVSRSVCFSPDGRSLAAVGGNEPGELVVWQFPD